MPPLSARASNPAEIVGQVDRYHVPTIADCDHYARILAGRLQLIVDPVQWRRHREDLDALIDRRLSLMQQGREAT